jgi:hypothetical protein
MIVPLLQLLGLPIDLPSAAKLTHVDASLAPVIFVSQPVRRKPFAALISHTRYSAINQFHAVLQGIMDRVSLDLRDLTFKPLLGIRLNAPNPDTIAHSSPLLHALCQLVGCRLGVAG